MNCPNCGNGMTGGAPHCATIKVQMECHQCGHYENEYYTLEEQNVNRLAAATEASFGECLRALERSDYDQARAERIIRENYLDRLCAKLDTTGADFAQPALDKELPLVTNAGLMFLTLTAQAQLGR